MTKSNKPTSWAEEEAERQQFRIAPNQSPSGIVEIIDAALEKAAQVARNFYGGIRIADAISALKSKPVVTFDDWARRAEETERLTAEDLSIRINPGELP